MRIALTAAFLGVSLTIAHAQARNWIDNAHFEAEEPALWEGGVIDHEVVHAGRGALRVDMPQGETSFSAPYGDGVDVSQTEAAPILAAFWLRPEAAAQTGNIRGGVTFHVDFRDGTMLAWYGPFEFSPEESGSWVYHEARWTPRAPIARIRPYVYMRGFEGSVYLDDIYLGPVTDLPVVERTTIPVSVTGIHGRFTDWPRFEITRFRPIAHVFQCDGPDQTNLELSCDIDVTRTAPIYLTSAWGSQYWTLYSTDRRELAEIYTDERLDLSEPGAQTVPVRMSGAIHTNAGDLAPGGWVFVTDRFKSFLIYSTEKPEGEPYEDARTGETFSFWDSVKLDPLSRVLGPSGVTAAFSLGDLREYELQMSAETTDGGVRVRPMLRDAGGKRVPLHDLTLTVRAGGREAAVQEELGPDGVPTGHYLWRTEGDAPQSVQVTGTVRLATPDGLVEEGIDATVAVGAAPVQPASPPPLELLGWGSGHYSVSPDQSEGPESIRRLIADARAAGVSRLVVGARGTDGDRYMSEISRGERPEYDQLALAVAEGRRQGVDIYAGYALGWAQEVDLEAHPDWAMIGSDGTPGTWYCYNNPEVRAFHASLVAEIVRNYDVAGVALDACRPGPGCHCQLCARLFQQRYGRPLEGVGHYDPEWREFQRESITDYMRELREAIRQARPDAKLSGYVWSRLAPDADRAGQDWPRWLNEGIMDWVCVGQYTPSTPLFRGECHTLKTIADRELGGDTSRIFPLLGVTYIQGAWPSYPLADAVIDQQLQAAREEGLQGAGYFPFYGIRTHPGTSASHSGQWQ
ncbi:MAG: family 10 glycosylhydrolase [Armatimonadota bacterium]|nr:family 10 glycosylhydrolase [Armatimonadota bacterium]